MAFEIPRESWTGQVLPVKIGAAEDEGSGSTVVIGGARTLPFLRFEGKVGNRPAVAMEIFDILPEGYPELVVNAFETDLGGTVNWAKTCVEKYGADVICLRLEGANPGGSDRSPEECAELVKKVLGAVLVPLMVYGCGQPDKDAKVIEAVSNAGRGRRLVLGRAEEDNYKSMAAAAMANGHCVVSFSNLDVNLAKQVNILLTDYGMKREDIIIDPLQAALGMGLEYTYSVVERIRLAALLGDEMLQMPMLGDATVSWESSESKEEDPSFGDAEKRGPYWETLTALSSLMAGADLILVRHPESALAVRNAIEALRESEDELGGGAGGGA